ncbi:PAS domain-containing sensor histidine kinase [Coraliomargarita parva]|uniref:PAS domain-containing sensor histidine kinase n=1 Tax=Coraliomargarita parva TaxID=3014050 RepID=UPI0022B4DDA4|nr:ATP-binding protein [Coraliomargarita parva]
MAGFSKSPYVEGERLQPGCFSSDELVPVAELSRQCGIFRERPEVVNLLDSLPGLILVLNQSRQVVFVNRAAMEFFGIESRERIEGLRPGHLAGCIHAGSSSGNGCGATAYCSVCGALHSILLANEALVATKGECQLSMKDGSAMNFKVHAAPYALGGESFTLFQLTDISQFKRQEALERIFFHDILNTVNGIHGLSEFLCADGEASGYGAMIHDLSCQLIEEIHSQQQFILAEAGELVPDLVSAQAGDIVARIMSHYQCSEMARGKELQVSPVSEGFALCTDPGLLRRVMGNLVKNALEATVPGGVVQLEFFRSEDRGIFRVRNEGVIPPEVQLQIFKRSYSTKGTQRGLGTYSSKLITEQSLMGQLNFSSDPVYGTVFTVSLPLAPSN